MGFFSNKNTPEAMVNNKIQQQLAFVNSKYVEIGRYIKLNMADKIEDENVKTMLAQIDTSLNELKNLNEQLNTIRGLKTCTNCSNLIPATVIFCPNCGAKQPVVATPVNPAAAMPAQANVQPQAYYPQYQQPVQQPTAPIPPAPAPQPMVQPVPVPQPEPAVQHEPIVQPVIQPEAVAEIPQPATQTVQEDVQPAPVMNEAVKPNTVFCSMCGHKEPATADFCSQCGAKL